MASNYNAKDPEEINSKIDSPTKEEIDDNGNPLLEAGISPSVLEIRSKFEPETSSPKDTGSRKADVNESFKNAHVEFAELFSEHELNMLEKLFRMANVAQDGLLNVTELKFFLDQHDYVISEVEARQIIKEADFDEDCALSYREFLFLCKRADINMTDVTKDLLVKSEGNAATPGESEGLVDSLKIRKVFQTIFDSIGFLPSIRETVEFFESKVKFTKRFIKKLSVKFFNFVNRELNPEETFTDFRAEFKIAASQGPTSETPASSPRMVFKKGVSPQGKDNFSVFKVVHKSPAEETNKVEDKVDADEVKIQNTVETGQVDVVKKEDGKPDVGNKVEGAHCGDFSTENDNDKDGESWDVEDTKELKSIESLLDFSEEKLKLIYQESLQSPNDSGTTSEFNYDLIVIGGGAGGAAAAKEAARLGKKVAVCDFMMPSSFVKSWGWRLGGSCVNVGCVPKMLMHHAGLIGECLDKKIALPFGWFSPEDDKVFSNDWSTLIDNIQSQIRTLNYERQFGLSYYKGIEYFNAHCEFDGPHKIQLTHEDKRTEFITGEKILIAVGSLYRYLDVPGAAGNCITVDDIFSLRTYPGKVLVVGGGPDAIECAGLLCSLNIEVTLMSKSQALKGFDRRMVTLILETLHSRGVKMMIGWTPTEITKLSDDDTDSKAESPYQKLNVKARHTNQTGEISSMEFNTVVLAIGKRPCTPLLKLERADVLVDDKTYKIWVDSQDMTTADHVFAIGDCANDRPTGTPVSYQAGVTLTKRLFEGSPQLMEYDQVIPKFLMTPVEYGCIGLSEEAAIFEHGEPNVQVYHARFQPLQFQLANRFKDTYYTKLITLKSENERVIGLHYLGPNAGEVIQGFALAVKLKATKADLDSMISIHPTCAEIFSKMNKTSAAEFGDETSF